MPKRSRSVEKGTETVIKAGRPNRKSDNGINSEDCNHINKNKVPSRRPVCGECEGCRRPKTGACHQQRCMNMTEEINENCSENINQRSMRSASPNSPNTSNQEGSTSPRKLRLNTQNNKINYSLNRRHYRKAKVVNGKAAETEANKFVRRAEVINTKGAEAEANKFISRARPRKRKNKLKKIYTRLKQSNSRLKESYSGQKVLVFWDDGIINIVLSDELYRSGGCFTGTLYKKRPKLEVQEKVKMLYNKCWYHGSILSVDEAEFVKVAAKYPPKHFVLRDAEMVVYSKPRETKASDGVLSEDEDLQMFFGDGAHSCLEPEHSGDEKSIGISECIEVQSIRPEDFDAMSEDVVDLFESEQNESPSRSTYRFSSEEPTVPYIDLIKPCFVALEINIANEMKLTDVYLVDQQLIVSLTDSESEHESAVDQPSVVKVLSPVKLKNQSQNFSTVDKLSPEMSPDLSPCTELIPADSKRKSQLQNKQTSPQNEVSKCLTSYKEQQLVPTNAINKSQLPKNPSLPHKETSKLLSSCKEQKLVPTNTINKSQSPIKQSSPWRERSSCKEQELVPTKANNKSQSPKKQTSPQTERSKNLSSYKELDLNPTNVLNKSQSPTKINTLSQEKNKVKSKSSKHSQKSLKNVFKPKVKNRIKDNYPKLVASKLSLTGVDVIPIETLDEEVADEHDISKVVQSLHQPNLGIAPAALSPEQQYTLETVTSQSLSLTCVTNQTSTITNSFSSDASFSVSQQFMKNTITSSPRVITLPVLSCDNYVCTTGTVDSSHVSVLPLPISNFESQNLVHETGAIELGGSEKSSSMENQKYIYSEAPSSVICSNDNTSPKQISPALKHNRINSGIYKKLQTPVASSHLIKDVHIAGPSHTMSTVDKKSQHKQKFPTLKPNELESENCKKLQTPVASSHLINDVHIAGPSHTMSKVDKKSQPKQKSPTLKPNKHESENCKKLQTPVASSHLINDVHIAGPSHTMSTVDKKSQPKQKSPTLKPNKLESEDCKKLQTPVASSHLIKDVHIAAPSHTNKKSQPKQKSLKLDPVRPNSKDCEKRQTHVTSPRLSQQTTSASNNSSFKDRSPENSDSDSQNHLISASIQICDILKEPSLADCIDGVPPFIQDVFLCENIRDGFINSDLVFVLSLLPDMEEMTDTQKFHFQMKVVQTLNDVLDDPKLQIKGLT